MSQFSHLDERGNAHMVDVSEKSVTARSAKAIANVVMKAQTADLIQSDKVRKGDVLSVARIAGIMAAKNTSASIPLCHSISIEAVQIEFGFADSASKDSKQLIIESMVKSIGRTGVEMEALMAAAISALTVYDMCKSYDREMTIATIELIEKRGGKTGDFVRSSGNKG